MKQALQARYGCAVELALDVLGGKWKTVILAHLKQRAMRYGELRQAVSGLSDKMLSQRLSELVELGLVRRNEDGRSVTYELDEEGRRAGAALSALYEWGHALAEEHGVLLDAES